jgi:predicted RNA binding protein YcfA (HicA-like mRNA interferase family)
MPKLPSISPEKLARVLEKCGFELERIKGSRHFYHNPETKKSASVPFHDKDVPKGLLNEMLKEAGISREEFFDSL